jgi:DNA-binding SARP family transcriptional activator
MEFEILGPVRARGECDVALPGRLQRVLLAVLLTRANHDVPADVLSDALWGEPGASKLYLHIHRLRRALGDPDRLISVPGGYRLQVAPTELDAERFEQLIKAAVGNDPARAAATLREAMALWRDVPFRDADSPALAAETQRLTDLHAAAVEELYAAELACSRHAAVVGELTERAEAEPLRERLQALLMLALYRSGQQDRALEVYRHTRQTLIDELGQEPGAELRKLHQQILSGQPTQDAPPPAQLPHDVPGFTGRSAELRLLDDLLTGDRPVLISAVAGTGGVGKTALAVRWAHRVRQRFPDGQLYVDLCGYGPDPPMAPDEVLAGFLRALGVDGTDIPTTLSERAARFRSLVATRRILVVLDNARTTEQVRPLLPGGSSARVVVTSRDALSGLVARDGAQRIPLDRLSEPDAVELLRGLVGDRVDAASEATRALVTRCARLPLALRIAAELINERPTQSLTEFVEELTETALDALDAGGDPYTAVRAVFSWSCHQLPPTAARLFRLLGLHPGHDADLAAMGALLDADVTATRSSVTVLRRAHLLDEVATGRYRAHDLLRAYAAELTADIDSPQEQASARARLFNHYRQAALSTDDRRWLDAERANLVTIAEHAWRHGHPRITIELATTLRRYLSLAGYHDEALALYRSSLEAARELGDLTAEGDAYRYIASVQRRFGLLHHARDRMRRALACYEQTADDRSRQLQLVNLATVEIWLGQYADGRGHLHEALQLNGSRLGRLGAFTYLGWLDRLRGDHDGALGHLHTALKIADPSAPREHIDLDMIIGTLHDRFGDYQPALEHLERARSVAFETGNNVIKGLTAPLAHVYWQLGRREDAFTCIAQSLAVAGHANERLVGMTVHNTAGDLYRLDGDVAQALAHYHAALDIAAAISSPYDEGLALRGIGDVENDRGNHAEAETCWRRALDVFRRLGTADVDDLEGKLRKDR